MIFRGFSTEILQGLKSWNLSPQTIRALNLSFLELVDRGLSAAKLDPEGVWYGKSFADPERPGHQYHYDVELDADLGEFWAVSLKLMCFDEDDHLVWWRECPTLPPPDPPTPV